MGSLARVLLHVWLYDFYDMGYFIEKIDDHVINIDTTSTFMDVV